MTKKVALLVRLEAKAGKEQEVADFIERALPLAQAEEDTNSWYALQIGTYTFGIFDTFPHEGARQEHLAGKIAQALMAKADELLSQPPVIEKVKVLAYK
jgi:quinol monooxygenase YgiN